MSNVSNYRLVTIIVMSLPFVKNTQANLIFFLTEYLPRIENVYQNILTDTYFYFYEY